MPPHAKPPRFVQPQPDYLGYALAVAMLIGLLVLFHAAYLR